MDTISYSSFRANLSSTLDKVNDDHTPIQITRKNGSAAVVLSLADYKSYEESAYLMASPRNAARLQSAIDEIDGGNATAQDLIDE